MPTTYLKRQKEMRRLEKQRQKAERRTQRKVASRRQKELPAESPSPASSEALPTNGAGLTPVCP